MAGQERYSVADLRQMGGLDVLLKSDRPTARPRNKKGGIGENAAQSEIPTEHDEQVAFFRWAKGDENSHPWLPEDMHNLLWGTPNGGYRHKKTAAYMKAEGQKAGVPDIFFAWSRLGYHGLFIEMKRTKGGTLSPDQEDTIESLRLAGFLVVVCKGCEEAQAAMRAYMIGNGKEFEA